MSAYSHKRTSEPLRIATLLGAQWCVMRSTPTAFILIVCLLLAGCTERAPGRADISHVKIGASRADVETKLEKPIEVQSLGDEQAATYEYFIKRRECGFWYRWVGVRYGFRVDPGCSDNWYKYHLTVVYDTSQKVVWCGPGLAQYETIKRSGARLGEVQECVKDAQSLSPEHQFSPSDVDSFYQISVELTDRVLAWNFACLVAHLGHQQAQDDLATSYYLGNEPVGKDFVKAYVWYTLAGREKNVVMTRLKSMTLEEIAEAERLVAEWQPNRVECETIRAPAAN